MVRTNLPLNALRAFEAAARHLSLTRAAEELGVTAGAVGRQVHGLEEILHVRLFRRQGNKLLLTPAGQASQPRLRGAFLELEEALDLMKVTAAKPSVTVSVDPSFAGLWLAPRLAAFREQEPSCDIGIVSPIGRSSPLPDNVDLAITYSDVRYEDCDSTLLHQERVLPVCSPEFLTQTGKIEMPEDLLAQPLIHIDRTMRDDPYPGWNQWFHTYGLKETPSMPSTHVSLAVLALQAAMADQGVAILSLTLIEQQLKKNELVTPLDPKYSLTLNRHLISHRRGVSLLVMRFRDWLLNQHNNSDGVVTISE